MSRNFCPRIKPVKMTFFAMPYSADKLINSLRSSPSPARIKMSLGFLLMAS